MKNYYTFLILCLFILVTHPKTYSQDNRGVKYTSKIHDVIIYESGKAQQFYNKAKKRKKNGETPTSNFEVTYNNFSDGAQKAFAKAVELWSYLIYSPVTIKINATYTELDNGVLGSASPNSFRRDFKNAPFETTWYPIALANKLAGFDIEPDNYDINANFSNKISWYFSDDGNCPDTRYDFISVVMHEIGHGLGFIGSANVEGANGSWGNGTKVPFVFDRFVYNSSNQLLIDTLTFDNPSEELKTEYTSGEIYFQSELSDIAEGGGPVKLYTPGGWDGGSSYSHLDDIYNGTTNSMMTPSSDKGEVSHHPGDITLGMFAEMGWINALFKHTAIKDMEEMNSSVKIETVLSTDSNLIEGSVYLHYSGDNFVSDINKVSMTTTDNVLFSSEIPVYAFGTTVKYFFEATTKINKRYFYPVQGMLPISIIDSTFVFRIGADMDKPELNHIASKNIFNFQKVLQLNINTNDNIGIDSVYIEYKVNDGDLFIQKCDSIEYSEQDNSFLYQTNISVEDLQDSDTLYYKVYSVDIAENSNDSILPAEGFFKVAILDLYDATQDLSINFDEDNISSMFFQNGLSIEQPAGFSSKGLHSPHPYEEGDPHPTDEIEYTAMLKTPITLKDNDSYIRFDEIVIVEPGEIGTDYYDHDFWDYVIVEGSIDSAKTWFAFEEGYDSRITTAFKLAYDNKSVGIPSMYTSHMINLLANENIKGGENVLIRFKLYSDQLAVGWGWAIDNIEIQGEVTSVQILSETDKSLNIYPSPSNGSFCISLKSEHKINDYIVTIYSNEGKIVYSENGKISNNDFKHNVNISNKPPGLYFIKLDFDNHSITKKIIIE